MHPNGTCLLAFFPTHHKLGPGGPHQLQAAGGTVKTIIRVPQNQASGEVVGRLAWPLGAQNVPRHRVPSAWRHHLLQVSKASSSRGQKIALGSERKERGKREQDLGRRPGERIRGGF